MNTRLEGGCQVPIGSYAELKDGELWLRALVGAPDGSQLVRGERRGPAEQAEALGISLAEELLDNGAREILAAVYDGEAPAMSILVTRPLPQGEALVSRLRAMGRVAWSFPLIEPPAGSFPRWAMRLPDWGPTICYLRYPSMRWNSPMPVCSSRACPGPLLRAILPLAARRRWPCIRSVGSISITR